MVAVRSRRSTRRAWALAGTWWWGRMSSSRRRIASALSAAARALPPVEDGDHAPIAALVGDAADDGDWRSSSALAQHDAGGGGEHVGEGFLLPLDMPAGLGVLGDA